MDANILALTEYFKSEQDYNDMLDILRDCDPSEYEEIIDSYGYGEVDLAIILEDL